MTGNPRKQSGYYLELCQLIRLYFSGPSADLRVVESSLSARILSSFFPTSFSLLVDMLGTAAVPCSLVFQQQFDMSHVKSAIPENKDDFKTVIGLEKSSAFEWMRLVFRMSFKNSVQVYMFKCIC